MPDLTTPGHDELRREIVRQQELEKRIRPQLALVTPVQLKAETALALLDQADAVAELLNTVQAVIPLIRRAVPTLVDGAHPSVELIRLTDRMDRAHAALTLGVPPARAAAEET